MSAAGKLEFLLELFRAGYLCNCKEWDEVQHYNEYDELVLIEELRHVENCEGRAKIQAILHEKDDNE